MSESFAYNGVYNFSENRVVDAFELEGLESVVVNGKEQYELSGSDLTDFNKTINDVGGTFVDSTGDGTPDMLGLNEITITGSVPSETQFKNNGLSTWIYDNVTVPITDFTQPLRDATAWTPERIAAYNQIMRESGTDELKSSLNSNMQAFGEMGVLGSGMWGGNLGKVYNAPNKEITVYRVFGGDSRAQGFSWTPFNPTKIKDFRNLAGLPSGRESGVTNTANFLIKGKVNPTRIIETRGAKPLDGNIGGLPEYIINPKDVKLTNFSILNP